MMKEITLILHNIRSTHNVGSIFRTAEGFGVKQVVLSGYTPYPKMHPDSRLPHEAEKITKQIHKTALGAEQMVPFVQYASLDTWLDANDTANSPLPIYGLEQSPSSMNIRQVSLPNCFALLLGEEVYGIESTLLQRCTGIVEIPMVGQKESFNVSVATGIALYALTEV